MEGSLDKQASMPGGMDAVVALYARGYCRTRYLRKRDGGLLRDVLAQQRLHDWEQAIAAAFHIEDGSLWPTLDAALATHFDQPTMS